jgi:Arc/MetJ-type ribon-helix-helix transcriptional regulator
VQINLRIPPDLIGLLDKLVDQEKASRPGSSVSRSDVIRDALYQVARERLGSKKGGAK